MFFILSLSPHVKVSVTQRAIAKFIDIIIVVILSAIVIYPIGPLLGFLYSVFADGINFGPLHGQSIGKKIIKLQVRSTVTQKPANWKDSLIRNTPVGIATFFAIIPVWGWLILALIGLPLMIMEVYLMATVDNGHRLGDVMGDTEVKALD